MLWAFFAGGQMVVASLAVPLPVWFPGSGAGRLPGPYDVVISEVMADPKPTAGLPESEYVELYNTLSCEVDLCGWSIVYRGHSFTLDSVYIPARSWLILCPAGYAGAFRDYGRVYGVEKMPSIRNKGAWITLLDEQGQIISFVDFTDTWYKDDHKKQGGWSLEQIDPFNPCGGDDNWLASCAPDGGTPGQANSVAGENTDWQAPELRGLGMPDSSTLAVHFSEPMHRGQTCRPRQYVLGGTTLPDTVFFITPGMHTVLLSFDTPFHANTPYRLTLGDSLMDCAGNLLRQSCQVEFERPLAPRPGDWIINEVLFNPWPGGSDYVELYNHSGRYLDLADLCIRCGSPGNLRTAVVAPVSRLVPPGTYMVLTNQPDVVEQHYLVREPDRLIAVADLPAMPDRAGEVMLLDGNLQLIDHMTYNEKMHFPLLSSREGVAMERIHFQGSSSDPANWHSASQPSGWGTPTYKNSQCTNAGEQPSPFSIAPEVISPDNDGFDDALHIHYCFSRPGHVVSVNIYDSRGRLVRLLVDNQAVGTAGAFLWDGLDGSNNRVRMGIYLVEASVYHLSGTLRQYRFACVVGRKL